MHRPLAYAAAMLLTVPLIAQTPDPAHADYDASTRTFPDEGCPTWQLVTNTQQQQRSLTPGALLLRTSSNGENIYYIQSGDELDFSYPLVVEFRARYLSGASGAWARDVLGVVVDLGTQEGASFFVGDGQVFFGAAGAQQGPATDVDTRGLHTYRLEIDSLGLVDVYYDDVFLMQGATYFSDGDFGLHPRIFWGESSSLARGSAEWVFFRHNGHATGCEDTDVDGDGSPIDLDCDDENALVHPDAPELFDGIDNNCNGLIDEELDQDGDGIPDFNDACPDTPEGDGVDPSGCASCSLSFDPDNDGDGFSISEDCDDSDPDVHPDAPEIPGNSVDENCDGVLACDPAAPWKSKGAYVRCVIGHLIDLRSQGEIDHRELRALFRAALRSK